MTRCYHCGQEIPQEQLRCGVRLSLLKTRIFDIIKRTGKDGITGNDLYDMVLKNRGAKRNVLKTHVHQINDRLAGTDYQIVVSRNEVNGHDAMLRLKKVLPEVGVRVIQPTASAVMKAIANPKSGG